MDVNTPQDLDAALRLNKLAKRTHLLARAKAEWRSRAWLGLNLVGLVLLFLERHFSSRLDALISLLEEQGLLRPEPRE